VSHFTRHSIKIINSTKCLLQSRLVLTNNVQKNIYTVNLRYKNEKWNIGSPWLKATTARANHKEAV
jgi:hypothetical protein